MEPAPISFFVSVHIQCLGTDMKKLTSLLIISSFLLAAVKAYADGPDAATRAYLEEMNIQEAAEPIRNWSRWRKPKSIVMMVPGADLAQRPDLLDWIREVSGDVELITVTGLPGEETLSKAEVFLGYCIPQLVHAAPKLRWLQNYGVGVDLCARDKAIRQKDFLVTNNRHYSAPPIAEHVIAMMMMLTRNLTGLHADQLQGVWDGPAGRQAPMIEVKDKTMLIAGLGSIGTEVAKRAAGLGMHVIATRNSSREGPSFVDYVGLSDELNTLAAKADVIVNAMPLTAKTTGIFNRDFFKVLRKGSYFISVGRGKSTVTDDLMAALQDGTLAGAGLDVTDPEPLPPGHPLWKMPNVIITPHNSSTSDLALDRRWIVIRDNIRRYINGEKMLNVVDIKAGY